MDMKKILLLLTSIVFFVNCEMQPKSYKYGIPEEEVSQILYGILNANSSASTQTTYGTIQYSTSRLEWKRCTQGQIFRQTEKDCQGTSSPSAFTPNDLKYGATRHAYCNEASNSCNSLALVPLLNSSNTSTSLNVTAYSSCKTDTTGVSAGVSAGSWRVPTLDELKVLASLGKISTLSIFPNTPDDLFWTATSAITDLEGRTAYAIDFSPGGYGSEKIVTKDTKFFIRCVRNY
jgi:hypothetical protein